MSVNQTVAGDLIPQIWATEIEYAANPIRGVARFTWDQGSRYFGAGKTVNLPIVPALPAANVKTTYPTVTYVDPSATTVVQATPLVVYTGMIIQEDVLLTTIKDTVQIYSPTMAEALYQKMDVDITGLSASTGSTTADAGVWTFANFAAVVMKLQATGGDKIQLSDMTAVYHIHTWDDWFATANVISAQVRGENNGPAKTGTFDTVLGVRALFTANITATGAGAAATASQNLVFGRKWVTIVRKNRPKVEVQREDLHTKVLASHMYVVKAMHTTLGALHTVALN